MVESIIRIQDKFDRFRTGLKEDQAYMARRADEEGCNM